MRTSLERYPELLQELRSLLAKGKYLYYLIRFYHVYPIVQTVSGQLSWSHFYALGDLKKEIFIAEYSLKLPSRDKIKEVVGRS